MNKNRYDNSIENNKREAFKANVKSNFKENLKRVPKFVAIYFVSNVISQSFSKYETNFMAALIGAAVFSIFGLMGLFSTNRKK